MAKSDMKILCVLFQIVSVNPPSIDFNGITCDLGELYEAWVHFHYMVNKAVGQWFTSTLMFINPVQAVETTKLLKLMMRHIKRCARKTKILVVQCTSLKKCSSHSPFKELVTNMLYLFLFHNIYDPSLCSISLTVIRDKL